MRVPLGLLLLLLTACGKPSAAVTLTPSAAAPVSSAPASVSASSPPLSPAPVALLQGAVTTSMGGPMDGSLHGGLALPLRGRGYVFHPARDPERRFGTVELLQALTEAAGAVDRAFPGSELTVGDLSRKEGGELDGHASHRSGRDVDVYFYLLDERGNPRAGKAIPLEPDGSGVDYGDLAVAQDDIPVRLDAIRTWAFIEALLANPKASVNRIYVVEHVRSLLLSLAKQTGAAEELVERFADVTCQPSFPHDDHMHIRLYCTPEDIDAGCRDTPPVYPWHAAQLRAVERCVELARAGRARVTSVKAAEKAARAKAGSFHPAVTAFLERRKAWVKKPRVGRQYCP